MTDMTDEASEELVGVVIDVDMYKIHLRPDEYDELVNWYNQTNTPRMPCLRVT